jgi:hypothetical protein
MTYEIKKSEAMSRTRRIHPAEQIEAKEEKTNGRDKV